MIDLRSDTVTRPSRAMLEAMMAVVLPIPEKGIKKPNRAIDGIV